MAFTGSPSRTAVIAVAALLAVPVAADATGLGASGPDAARTDAAHAPLVDWAVDRYEAAGLALPDDTIVTFFDSEEPCEGNRGTVREDRGHEVYVCVGDDEPNQQEHVLLHELAHLWTDHSMGSTIRDEFLAFRGADNWNDRTEDWWNRGTEQAAEVLTWGLLDRDPGFQRINDRACETMLEGFEILTGSAPINPTVDC